MRVKERPESYEAVFFAEGNPTSRDQGSFTARYEEVEI